VSAIAPKPVSATRQAPPEAHKFLLEAHHYTDPAWLEREQTQIFQQTWLYVGDGSRLSPGQVWATSVAGKPIVITRSATGQFQAFYNLCPHRASLLCNDPGIHHQKQLICPYHAWAYSLEGDLVGTPSRDRLPQDFAPEDYPLKPVRLETWSGFLFVCLSDSAPSLTTVLGSIVTDLGNHRRETTQLLLSQSQEVGCNWKNYHDNTLCDYHVAIAHRNTIHKLQGPIKQYRHQFEAYINLLYTPVPESWKAENRPLAGLSELASSHFFTYGLFPNLHLLGFPNGMLAWIQIEPLTASTCQVNLEVYGIPEMSPAVETLKAEFDAFMAEDVTLTESVQRGYASGAYTPGPVSQLENRIVHQQQLILAHLQRGD
jgi:phenylpropionate dioxygenase-like ring-hydroxylating dioxygenase large terminal subunit